MRQTKSWQGQVTFAMVPTLARSANLDAMPALDLLVIDEAHHAVAESYRRIIDRALHRNPMLRIFGVTATPNRGDKRGLRQVFSNVADQVRLGELIASGHLVPPRTFVIDLGVQEQLREVRRSATEFDMDEVDAIMNRAPITEEVVRHWREKAGDRQTVVFCSTVAHADNVAEAFRAAGVAAQLVHGDMAHDERRAVLGAYAAGRIQVVVNVAVLTEGWDHPPTSCVVLLRPSSFKSTMIQMVGRGLRTVDPEEHPGLVKTDCIVLDFGTSSLLHGTLEQDVDLIGHEATGEAPIEDLPGLRRRGPARHSRMPALRLRLGGRRRARIGGGPAGQPRRVHDDRDRPPEAVELRLGRPLRRRRGADGERLHRLGWRLFPRGALVRGRRRQGRALPPARRSASVPSASPPPTTG